MSEAASTLLSYGGKLTREQLALVATPPGTTTHRPIPRADLILHTLFHRVSPFA
jgi:hypothetical protein